MMDLPRGPCFRCGASIFVGPSRRWVELEEVELEFSRPGRLTDNAFIGAFNGRLRQEGLNENWFLSLERAEDRVQSWRRHYNGERPHSALNNLSPREFAALETTAD